MATKITGLTKLNRKLKLLPRIAQDLIRKAMERSAEEICDMMRNLVPVDDMVLHDSIGWTWGKAPPGSITIASVDSVVGDDTTITIYAGNKEAYYARWVEFGTTRFTNKGMFAGTSNPGQGKQPFFYVSWRAKKKGTKRRIRSAVTRAAKKAAAGY